MDSRDSGSSVGSPPSSGHGSSDCLNFISSTVFPSSGSSSKYCVSSSDSCCVLSIVLWKILWVFCKSEFFGFFNKHSISSRESFNSSFFVWFFKSISHDNRQSQIKSFSVDEKNGGKLNYKILIEGKHPLVLSQKLTMVKWKTSRYRLQGEI